MWKAGLLRSVVGALVLLSIASCKLRVVVPEDGSVTTSSGSFSCASGETCDIDVVDFFFDETFTGIAANGNAFTSWQKGSRQFCGNSPKPCHLFTANLPSNLMALIGGFIDSNDEVFYLQPVFSPLGDSVPVNGKEWLQPDLFSGLTWDEINAVCPEGVCVGVLNNRDMKGWTWASVDDVNELFNYYIGRKKALGPGGGRFEEVASSWAPAFFNTGWRTSYYSDEYHSAYGWSRTISLIDEYGSFAYTPGIEDCLAECPSSGYPPGTDTAHTDFDGNTEFGEGGAWFFREIKQ